MLYPGTIFGIAAHVSGETAKAVSTAVLSMPASSFGKWSLVTDFGQIKDLYRTLKRGPYAHPKSRSKPSRYSSENDVLIEKSVKYTDFFLLSIVYV